MQNIELAIKSIIDKIGENYKYPVLQNIVDAFNQSQTLKNPYFGQTPSKVKFMFGTQKELNIWLAQTKDKYPVIWLVYPVKEIQENVNENKFIYEKMRLIFAINNTVDKLVQTRVQTTRFVLNQIVAKFISLTSQGEIVKYLHLNKKAKLLQSFEPNYSASKPSEPSSKQGQSGSIDIWDAIVLDLDLIFQPDCFK